MGVLGVLATTSTPATSSQYLFFFGFGHFYFEGKKKRDQRREHEGKSSKESSLSLFWSDRGGGQGRMRRPLRTRRGGREYQAPLSLARSLAPTR